MSSKTLTRRASALSVLAGGLEIRDGQLMATPALLEGLKLAQELQESVDEFYGSIKTFLEVNKCEGTTGEWGYVKLSSQSRFAISGKVAPRFLKQSVDSDEVKHWKKHHAGKLPAGIKEVKFNRLTKKIKEEA